MKNLSIKDLIDLVASEAETPETRVEKMFEWEHSRRLEAVKWILTAAAAFFVPFLIAYFKGEISQATSNTWVLAALFSSVLFGLFGLTKLYRIRYIHRSFVSALVLLAEMKRIAPLIRRYRGLGG